MKKHLSLKEALLVKLRIVSVRSNKDIKKKDDTNNEHDNENENSLIGKMYNILNDDDNVNEIYIGRSRKTNQIVIKDLSISTNHAKIEFRKGRFYLSDLQSKHGTHVNSKKLIVEEYVITIGTEIRFGRIICQLVNLEPIQIEQKKEVENISIKNMKYYENLLIVEEQNNQLQELYENFNDKKRKVPLLNPTFTPTINSTVTDGKSTPLSCNEYKNINNNKRLKLIANTRMIAPTPMMNISVDDDEKVYGAGFLIMKNLGHDPKKKLGKNKNDDDANKPLQVKIRRKNLGLGARV